MTAKRSHLRSHQVRGAGDKASGKLGKLKLGVQFESQSHQGFGAAAVLLRQMKIAGRLQRHRNLRRQHARGTNVLLRDAGPVQPIQHPEHAQHFAAGVQQRARSTVA